MTGWPRGSPTGVGLAVVFVAVPWLFIGSKAAGAAYLAVLAWQAPGPGGFVLGAVAVVLAREVRARARA